MRLHSRKWSAVGNTRLYDGKKSGSHVTRRRRETDSNSRSLSRMDRLGSHRWGISTKKSGSQRTRCCEGTGFEPPVPQEAFGVVVAPVCIRADFALPGNQAEVDWFVFSVLNALRETNRWLAFLSRVRWDETREPESPNEQ
jgi:hypothetical protein